VGRIAAEVRQQSDRIDRLQQQRIETMGVGLVAALLTLTAAMLGSMITILVTHV
jgi:hypothetical protein